MIGGPTFERSERFFLKIRPKIEVRDENDLVEHLFCTDAASHGLTTRTNNDMLEFGQTYTTSTMKYFSTDASKFERNWKRLEYEMLSKIKPQNILCLDV